MYQGLNQFGPLNHFQADNIRPVRPRRPEIPPAWQAEEIIGKRGSYYTVIECRILRPTIEYPDVAIRISLSNGRSYTFTTLALQELDHLVSTLNNWKGQADNVVAGLQQESAAIKAQATSVAQHLQQIRAMTGLALPTED